MKAKPGGKVDDLRPEYDFDYTKAVRGKYYKRLLEKGSNVVVLDPDVAKAFKDSAAVNAVLRSLLELARSTKRAPRVLSARTTRNAILSQHKLSGVEITQNATHKETNRSKKTS